MKSRQKKVWTFYRILLSIIMHSASKYNLLYSIRIYNVNYNISILNDHPFYPCLDGIIFFCSMFARFRYCCRNIVFCTLSRPWPCALSYALYIIVEGYRAQGLEKRCTTLNSSDGSQFKKMQKKHQQTVTRMFVDVFFCIFLDCAPFWDWGTFIFSVKLLCVLSWLLSGI